MKKFMIVLVIIAEFIFTIYTELELRAVLYGGACE